MTAAPDPDTRDSAADLVGSVIGGLGRLVRGEIDLARAEAKKALSDAMAGIVFLLVAALLALVALNVMAGAAVAALAAMGVDPLWATIIVGVVILVVAFILVKTGLSRLKPENLAPKRTLRNVARDAETLKAMVVPRAASDARP